MLTERQITDCIAKAACFGTVKMSYDSGPYEITRPSINATRFAEAIEAAATAEARALVGELSGALWLDRMDVEDWPKDSREALANLLTWKTRHEQAAAEPAKTGGA